jgi:hypothetical protein
MRCIVDQLQSIGVGDLLQALRRTGVAVTMHGQDRGGTRSDRGFHQFLIQVAGVRPDIDENRLDSVPEQRVRGCGEGVRRGDDFARDPQGLQRSHQRQRAVGEKAHIGHAQILSECILELLVKWSAVGEPSAFPDLGEIGKEVFEWRQVGAGQECRFRNHESQAVGNKTFLSHYSPLWRDWVNHHRPMNRAPTTGPSRKRSADHANRRHRLP